MRIALISTLEESVPPQAYGGVERVVAYLAEELVVQGHQVTVFASGDSKTTAELVAACPYAIRLDPYASYLLAYHLYDFALLEQVSRRAGDFDLIHYHNDYLHLPYAQRLTVPHLTTLHRRLDMPALRSLFQGFRDVPVVSISNAQRQPLPWLNWQATIHHGLPKTLYTFQAQPGDYLAFLGRIAPEKRPDEAIAIARRAGRPLKIAARVDAADREYFERRIRPLLDPPWIEFIGEIREHEKNAFLGQAQALLFPINSPEPFGLVMIEALACGTPVIAYRQGATAEVIDDGVTGYIVAGSTDAVQAIDWVSRLDRRRCRQAFEQRFTATRMARDYMAIYRALQHQGR